MKKIIFLLLICSGTFTLFAQEQTTTENSKTKIKNDKTKMKDADGKLKIKDDKVKLKDADGKVKIKSEGTMNANDNSLMNSMNTSTNVNVVTIGGWTTNPANLPVIGNGVTDDVVAILKNKYGASIYDVKQIKSNTGQNIYVVRIMDNGGIRTDYVGADGNAVSQ